MQVCQKILQHSIATISKQRCLLPRQASTGLTRMLVPIATLSKPIATNRRRAEVGHWSGVIPSQLIQASRLVQTLSLHGLHGQPAMLRHECPPQFHWARHIMKPWTLLCGALLEKNSLSRVTSITGSLAKKVLEASWWRNRGPSAANWSNKFQSSVLVLCQSLSRCTVTVLISTVQATSTTSTVVRVEIGPHTIHVAEIKRIK